MSTGGTLSNQGAVRGVVASVHREASGGFAAVLLLASMGEIPKGERITFSFSDWRGNILPRKGQVVQLESLTLFEKGWRALAAIPIQVVVDVPRTGGLL
ncbi:MAG: hypothetical protein WC246_00730 [Candidatus Paceibacterota bacterium]|jgi:hypothetical protein